MNNNVQTLFDFRYWKGRESEPGTSTLDSRNNLVDVVANDTEPDVLCVLLDNTPKRSLGSGGHHISFVKDDEFETLGEQCSRLGKVLDLLANNVNTSIVGRIQLKMGAKLLSLLLRCPIADV